MEQMQGQLWFDEWMNILERKTHQETVKRRKPMVDQCYYCACNSCINNVENPNVSSDEIPDNWVPCFFCDDCRKFDGDTSKKCLEREQCIRYEISNYHAEENRKGLKVVK